MNFKNLLILASLITVGSAFLLYTVKLKYMLSISGAFVLGLIIEQLMRLIPQADYGKFVCKALNDKCGSAKTNDEIQHYCPTGSRILNGDILLGGDQFEVKNKRCEQKSLSEGKIKTPMKFATFEEARKCAAGTCNNMRPIDEEKNPYAKIKPYVAKK